MARGPLLVGFVFLLACSSAPESDGTSANASAGPLLVTWDAGDDVPLDSSRSGVGTIELLGSCVGFLGQDQETKYTVAWPDGAVEWTVPRESFVLNRGSESVEYRIGDRVDLQGSEVGGSGGDTGGSVPKLVAAPLADCPERLFVTG